MRYRTFGRTGWKVSEIGYGMWGMGGWTGSDDNESARSLDRAIELGCSFFDTAFAYGMGKSEKLLGDALGRHKDKTTVEELDVRVGGRWHFVCEGPDGTHGFSGVYRELEPPARVVQTFEWDGMPGYISVDEADLGPATFELASRGLYAEPTSAAILPAIREFVRRGSLRPGETAVAVLTGTALKAADTIGRLL